MTNLIKNKIVIIVVLILVLSVVLFKIKYFYVPDLGDYKSQKAYTQKVFLHAKKTSEGIFFAPNIVVGEFLKRTVGENSWDKSAITLQNLLKKYPEQAVTDVDVYGWFGDTYDALKNYDKAREYYQTQLDEFKKQYYKKDYSERAHLSDTQPRIEEVRYIVRAHFNIAKSYNAQKQYDKAIEEYDESITYIDDLDGVRETITTDIFLYPFRSKGKILKVIKKDYDGAIENYLEMKEKLRSGVGMSLADIFIGDTYLAKGDIEKAKEVYREVIETYKNKPPGYKGTYDTAERRLEDIEKGKVVATDGVLYTIKDGKVTVTPI